MLLCYKSITSLLLYYYYYCYFTLAKLSLLEKLHMTQFLFSVLSVS